MSDSIEAFQTKLDQIAEERSARNELVGKRMMEQLAETDAQLVRQSEELDAAMHAEDGRRARVQATGGWELTRDDRDRTGQERFGFEDDQDYEPVNSGPERSDRTWPKAGQSQAGDAAGIHSGRHEMPEHDDDDFANTNWLSR